MNYSVMIDLILMGCAYVVLVWILMRLVKARRLTIDPTMTSSDKKFKVKIVSNHGEKTEFSSLEEKDIKRVIETLVALKKHREKDDNKN